MSGSAGSDDLDPVPVAVGGVEPPAARDRLVVPGHRIAQVCEVVRPARRGRRPPARDAPSGPAGSPARHRRAPPPSRRGTSSRREPRAAAASPARSSRAHRGRTPARPPRRPADTTPARGRVASFIPSSGRPRRSGGTAAASRSPVADRPPPAERRTPPRTRCRSSSGNDCSTGRAPVPLTHSSTALSPCRRWLYVVSHASTDTSLGAERVDVLRRARDVGAQRRVLRVLGVRLGAGELAQDRVRRGVAVAGDLDRQPAARPQRPDEAGQQVELLGDPLQGRVGDDHVQRTPARPSTRGRSPSSKLSRSSAYCWAASIICGELSTPCTVASGQRSSSVTVRLPGPQPRSTTVTDVIGPDPADQIGERAAAFVGVLAVLLGTPHR